MGGSLVRWWWFLFPAHTDSSSTVFGRGRHSIKIVHVFLHFYLSFFFFLLFFTTFLLGRVCSTRLYSNHHHVWWHIDPGRKGPRRDESLSLSRRREREVGGSGPVVYGEMNGFQSLNTSAQGNTARCGSARYITQSPSFSLLLRHHRHHRLEREI